MLFWLYKVIIKGVRIETIHRNTDGLFREKTLVSQTGESGQAGGCHLSIPFMLP